MQTSVCENDTWYLRPDAGFVSMHEYLYSSVQRRPTALYRGIK